MARLASVSFNMKEGGGQMSDQPAVTVGLGEVLWNVFPDGPRFGVAPANLACQVAALVCSQSGATLQLPDYNRRTS